MRESGDRMANKWSQEIVFRVKTDSEEAKKELREIAKEVNTLETNDGIVLQTKVDEKGLLKFDEIYRKYSSKDNGKIKIQFDEGATRKTLSKIENNVDTSMNKIVDSIKQYDKLKDSLIDNDFKERIELPDLDIESLDNKKKELSEIKTKIEKEINEITNSIKNLKPVDTQKRFEKSLEKQIEEFNILSDKRHLSNKEIDNFNNNYGEIFKRYIANEVEKFSDIKKEYLDFFEDEITEDNFDKFQNNFKKDYTIKNKLSENKDKLQKELSQKKVELEQILGELNNIDSQIKKHTEIKEIKPNLPKDYNSLINNKTEEFEKEIQALIRNQKVEIEVSPSKESLNDFYSIIENNGSASIKIEPNKETLANFYDSIVDSLAPIGNNIKEIITKGIKEGFSSNGKTEKGENINEKNDKINDFGLKNNLDSLVLSLKEVPQTFREVTSLITGETKLQENSIMTVKKAVDSLNESLKRAGVDTVGEFTSLHKEFDNLQKKQNKLNEDRKKFEEYKNKIEQKTSISANDFLSTKDKIIKAGENTKNIRVDSNSFDYKDGLMSYKIIIDETADSYSVLTVKAKDFSKAITKSGNLSKKFIDDHSDSIKTVERRISKEEEKLKSFNKFKLAISKTNGFDYNIDSYKTDNNGIITFTRSVEDAQGKITQLKYEIKDLDKVIYSKGRYAGQFTKDFVASGKDISYQKESDKLIKQYKEVIGYRKKLELLKETTGDNSDLNNNKLIEVKDKEARILSQINDLKNKNNLTTEEELKIQKDLLDAKEQEVKLFNINDNQVAKNKRKKIESEYNNLKKIDENKFLTEVVDKNGDQFNARNELINLKSEATELMSALSADAYESKAAYDELYNSLNRVLSSIKKLDKKEYKKFEFSQEKGTNTKFKELDKKFSDLSKINTSDLIGEIFNDKGELVSVTNEFKRLNAEAERLMNILNSGDIKDKANFEDTAKELDNVYEQIKKITSDNNKLVNSNGNFLDDVLLDRKLISQDKKSLEQEIEKALTKDGGILKNIKLKPNNKKADATILKDGVLKSYKISLEELGDTADKTVVRIRALSVAEKEYQGMGSRWLSGMKSKISSLTQYITGLDMVMRAWNEVQQGFNFVKELDSAMSTVYQTMDITKSGLNDLGSGAIQAAKDLGSVSENVIDAIGIYAAYGETVESILSQSRPTTMLANAANTDAKTAADQIQAVLQQYEDLKGQETRIVNSYEKIAANVQIDFDKFLSRKLEIAY